MFIVKKSENQITIKTPAKINLFLQVLNKRTDGYHNINSLFQAVSLYDNLEFERSNAETGIDIQLLESRSPEILPIDKNNLISKAFHMIQSKFNLSGHLSVKLDKKIPIAAGLAGGSSDAAATILACSKLWGLQLKNDEMAALGLEIGSDIPFFFSTGQAIVTGRGENIEISEFPTDYWLLLVTPNLSISTAESYSALSFRLTNSALPISLGRSRTALELAKSLTQAMNDFEEHHLKSYPELEQIKENLLASGAVMARMSGSGPTFFGLFERVPEPTTDILTGQDKWQVFAVQPVILPA